MLQEYADRLNWAKSNKKLRSRVFSKSSSRDLDERIHRAHEKAFECTDCLKCANCCKTTGPLFTQADVKRLSRRLKVSEADFVARFLQSDEDGDLVLQALPCPFLLDDHRCEVYEDRPRACRSYPHTNESGQAALRHLTMKNASICPAVAHIFQQLATRR